MADSDDSNVWWDQRISQLHDLLHRDESDRLRLPLCTAAKDFGEYGRSVLKLLDANSNVAQVRQADLILTRRFRQAFKSLDPRHKRRCARTNRCLVDVYVQLSELLEDLELHVNLPAPLVTDYDRVVRRLKRLEQPRPVKVVPPAPAPVPMLTLGLVAEDLTNDPKR